jgi:hypothetical protein
MATPRVEHLSLVRLAVPGPVLVRRGQPAAAKAARPLRGRRGDRVRDLALSDRTTPMATGRLRRPGALGRDDRGCPRGAHGRRRSRG